MTVTGLKLWNIYNYIHRHRLDRIQPSDRRIDQGLPLIKSIVIERIEDGADAGTDSTNDDP